jgi:hypothetical protein
MTLDEARKCIADVQKEYPELDAHGLQRFDKEGRKIGIHPQEFIFVIEWLLNYDSFDRRRTIYTGASSYSWKHTVERDTKEYISNGAFICAALYLKYKMKKIPNSPNAYFNLRKDTRHALR